MKNIKSVISLVLICAFLLASTTGVFAAPTYGFHAQHNYYGISGDYGNCSYGNRSCPLYCDYLEPFLKDKGFTWNYKWYDSMAWESDMTYSSNAVDNANFFVWGGHGIDYSSDVGVDNDNESGAHFFNLNSFTSYHSLFSHSDRKANATWSEIRWGKNIDYAVMWTCNFLHTGGDSANLTKIFKMFNGMHIMLGFASKMYVNPDEAKSFGQYLKDGYKLKDAWVNATQKYQPDIGSSPTVYASWVYHVDHELDTLQIHSDPVAYSDGSTKYGRKYYTVAN